MLEELFAVQRRIYVFHDGTHDLHILHDLPPTAYHIVSNFRRFLPRLQGDDYDVPRKTDADSGGPYLVSIISFIGNKVLARKRQSSQAMAFMLVNPGGHIMLRGSYAANRFMDSHSPCTKLASRWHIVGNSSHEHHFKTFSDVDVKPSRLTYGEEVSVGDTVVASTGECPCEGAPYRLAGLYFQHTAPGGHDKAQSPESPSHYSLGHTRVDLQTVWTVNAVVGGERTRQDASA